jgi:O-antigen/teichoic acid export membrane protein
MTARTRVVVLQSILGLASVVGAGAAAFAAMPLMLALLGKQSFGVWLVLLSVFQWITLFDLGVSSGARNEIARAAAHQDHELVRTAITTGWLYVAFISLGLFILAAMFVWLTPAHRWLVVRVFGGVDPGAALWLVVAGACIAFALGYVQSAFAALERASAFSLFSLISNVTFAALLLLAPSISVDRMSEVAALYLMAIVGANLWLVARFFFLYPLYRPRLTSIDHRIRHRIMGFGLRLFVIQLAALVIFTTSRVMASLLLGPESVVVYEAGFKIFSVITMAHTMIMSTLWSSFTQAYERGELQWIRSSLRRLTQAMVPLLLGCAVLAWACPWLISNWLGADQVGSPSIYALFALTTVLGCWSNTFAYFLNGIGNTSVQLWSAIAACVVNIPATYVFTVTLGFGLSGILLASFVSLSFFSVLGPVQVKRLLQVRTN